MTNTQFTVARILAIPVALLFSFNWIALAPRLEESRATKVTGVVSRSTFKRQPVATVQYTALGELRVYCEYAPELCEPRIVPEKSSVALWVQRPAFLHEYWVVAAELNGRRIISAETQAPRYTEAKIKWGLGTLVPVFVVFLLWYFGPYKKTVEE